ncbi:protein disulfide oxidoreductase [Thioalkalivibrio denitrificans]|uniref:Protein disulfide oxidoreductase n=1 Tax=Thioalkalivibrio denitrificans TaxID=108003 RepID=A0A1V3NDR9_9GAMM|nr:protein disulfide oxidoreductase [Thioalkalivibrio denitrificans]OOG23239.1 protein disulfide oxidoreductase [Thioalkalivibrio denitrificans]
MSTKRSKHRRWLIWGAEILFFVVLFFAVKAWVQRDMISGEAPTLAGIDLHGQEISLADYRGQTVLVHFWATWCRICRLEQGSIESLSRSWPVLTVATQSGEVDELIEHMAANDLTHLVIPDPDGRLAASYGVRGVPASFVVDADGEIRFRETGFTTNWGLRARLWMARVF